VHGHITEGAGAKIKPAPPYSWMIGRMVRPLGRCAQPQIPFEIGRNGRGVAGAVYRLFPPFARAIRPGVHLPDRTDGPGLNPFADLAETFASVPIVTHLRDEAG